MGDDATVISEEAYCADSDEDIIQEQGEKGEGSSSDKRSSIDHEIDNLTSDILMHIDQTLDLQSCPDPSSFQDRIDILIKQMTGIAQYIDRKCEMIEKMNILMCILTFKIFDIQHEFNTKLEVLKDKKENILLSQSDESIIPLELLDEDRNMRELQLSHYEKSKVYKQQKVDMQIEYEKTTALLDEQLVNLKMDLKVLEKEHELFANETSRAEPFLVDYIIQAALEEFTVTIEQFEDKQKKGWKTLYGDEEMLDNLQSKNLAISKSGYILTETGEKLSYDDAVSKNLLQGLNFRGKLFPKEITHNDDIEPSASSCQSVEESEKESLASQISSEDVSYLKETLGKPLTLALAEITAKQPRDPIHYLGHWLFKYRYNQELDVTQKQEYEALMVERNRLLKEKLHRLYEEEARLVIFEMINNAENDAIRKELERILREQVMAENEEDDQAAQEYGELKKLLDIIDKND